MEISDLPLAGLKLVQPRVFEDGRGYFLETHHLRKYATHGLDPVFVQDNLSYSKQGVLRGLHYQYPKWQGKLVSVIQGEIFDVAVDLRRDSPTFGQWFGLVLSEHNHLQLYVPPGFAHGFCVTSDQAYVHYKCTDYYQPEQEHTILWNDPAIGIEWPVREPSLSEKDARGKPLAEAVLPG
jgi:dTDP-4-dehydrorhamnose 3,5-epimerase